MDRATGSSSAANERDLAELREFMTAHVRSDAAKYYGLGPKHYAYLETVVDRWFDDSSNYDGRWNLFDGRLPRLGKILDMSSGCGTFVLHGLRRGHDVWGIEPEDWKLEYFRRKAALLGLPADTSSRVVKSFGERLPFADATFDLVTSYQTIEHVADVGACINELLRVVKPGGVVHLSSPDYQSFFEPHYRVPFLPTMKKALAARYLSLLGRPSLGLKYLNWVTDRSVVELLNRAPYPNQWVRFSDLAEGPIRERILDRLPSPLRTAGVVDGIRVVQRLRQSLRSFAAIGPINGSLDYWIVRT